MFSKKLSGGVVHKMPADLRQKLTSTKESIALWEDITPLARNEFICWVVSAKQDETRARRVTRTWEELVLEGKRRPCCWAGCPHRK